jgi:hypothetical protein
LKDPWTKAADATDGGTARELAISLMVLFTAINPAAALALGAAQAALTRGFDKGG